MLLAVQAQLESLLRAKASGCWLSGGGCPELEVEVNPSQIEEHQQLSDKWYTAQREHASQHPGVRTQQMTTEGCVAYLCSSPPLPPWSASVI